MVATNPEAGLFDLAKGFRFADGTSLDFGGDTERSINGYTGTLSNSNERARKGFTTTFTFKRDFKGAVGRMRLDWVFVKPGPPKLENQDGGVQLLAPYFGRTLAALNGAIPDGISDHHPLIVDLPLSSVPVTATTATAGN